jgi:hypothetical protein
MHFEDVVRDAQFIVLADAVSVGGPENRAPTLTPTSTGTATATDTRVPSATRTPTPTRTVHSNETATPTDTPSPAPKPQPWADLTGTGAVLSVVRTYAGTPPASPFTIDDATRARVEAELRGIEAGFVPICPFWAAQYQAEASYIVFGGPDDVAGTPATRMRLRVRGGDVVLCDGTPEQSCPYMRGATYRRYFAGVEASIQHNPETGDDYASLTAPRMPLAQMAAAIAAMRNPIRFSPPETGNAGLAARR